MFCGWVAYNLSLVLACFPPDDFDFNNDGDDSRRIELPTAKPTSEGTVETTPEMTQNKNTIQVEELPTAKPSTLESTTPEITTDTSKRNTIEGEELPTAKPSTVETTTPKMTTDTSKKNTIDQFFHRQLQSDCTAQAVANNLADVFEGTYAALTQELCDPFRRLVESISCENDSFNNDAGTSGTLRCTIQFRCSGPCGDWIDKSAIYQSQDEFTTSTSCICNTEGGAKRAPLPSNHIDSINVALQNGISVLSIST